VKFVKAATLVIGGLATLATTMAPASAATLTFDWTLTGPSASLGGVPFPGSGTITATTSAGGDLVTAITGTVGGSTITGLTTFNGSDNLVFPIGTTFLDTKGIAFTTAAGQNIDIFSFFAQGTPPSGNAYGELATNGFGVGTFTLTQTPLPSTWTMMLLGIAGIGGMFYSRRGRNSAAFAAAA
jgi:hypothetical protein